MIEQTLSHLGWSEKQVHIYLALLRLGPSPVRKLALASGINRGTTYDILKSLRALGVVGMYNKKTKQYFVAEDPDTLLRAHAAHMEELAQAKSELQDVLPQLRSLYAHGGAKPVALLFEGPEAIGTILRDVLERTAQTADRTYYAYSAPDVRSQMYAAMPKFNEARVRADVRVRVIALDASAGLHGLDERRVLRGSERVCNTYTFLYADRVAYLTHDASGEVVGMIIDNAGMYQTQCFIFASLWDRLKP
jgi:HTH-type transcriptional regulator, sugar sensing transcriptional regulator